MIEKLIPRFDRMEDQMRVLEGCSEVEGLVEGRLEVFASTSHYRKRGSVVRAMGLNVQFKDHDLTYANA